MKKLILLSAAGLLGFGADAQQSRVSVARIDDASSLQIARKEATVFAGDKITQSRHRNNFKVTATPFYTETFGSGTTTSLPTGWSAASGAGFTRTWRWTNVASPAPYNIGTLNSSSKNDGWMIYDSDSIGNTNPTVTPVTGTLVSPPISCTGHTSVMLTFEEYFRAFQDSCFVDVSTNSGASWTTFPVVDNNALTDNSYVPSNSYTARVNITSVAAGQANVTLRFRYVGAYAGGSYNWLIDDVKLAELEQVELGIDNSGLFLYLGAPAPWRSYSLFSNYPVQLVDSLLPVTYLTNHGLDPQTNVTINAKVFNGATNVYDYNQVVPTSPYTAKDSIIDWASLNLYKPTSLGSYTAAFSVNQSGDALPSNNIDTTRFNITDTMLTTYGPLIAGSSYYLHRAPVASTGVTEVTLYQGVRFDIPAGKTDTVTSISVSYDNRTTVGVTTIVQLYKVTGINPNFTWDPVISMRQKTLTAGDISTPATRVWTVYGANAAVGPNILTAGTYAAVVSTVGAPSTSTVLISAAIPMNNQIDIAGYFGQTDTSKNTANFDFAQAPGTNLRTGYTDVPLVRVNFGNKWKLAVNTIQGVTIGEAFPNPANNTVSVPVSVTSGTNVNVTLSNMMGQVLQTQALGSIGAGQRKTAVFNTSDLAAGIYLYTVESNGQRVSNRVVVAH